MFEGGSAGGEKACALRKELGDLERAERSLDELIHSSTAQLKQLTDNHPDSQRYPFSCAPSPSCVRPPPVVTLDPTLHAGLRDVPGHPLPRQPPRPDGHRRQGPCGDQARGPRRGGGESTRLRRVTPLLTSFTLYFHVIFMVSESLSERSKAAVVGGHLFTFISRFTRQGSLQIYLKSKNGPIEVYLCPEEGLEDASPVKSSVTPKKEFPQPLGPPAATPAAPSSYSVKEEPVESKTSFLWDFTLDLRKFSLDFSLWAVGLSLVTEPQRFLRV